MLAWKVTCVHTEISREDKQVIATKLHSYNTENVADTTNRSGISLSCTFSRIFKTDAMRIK